MSVKMFNSVLGQINLLLLSCILSAAGVSLAAHLENGSTSSGNLVFTTEQQVEVSSTASPTSHNESQKKSSSRGNPTASDRLMKELRRIHNSETCKKGHYSVELVNECLYEWRVRLFAPMFDADSKLHADLIKLGETSEKNYVELGITFTGAYPFAPPLVRLAYPVINTNRVFTPGGVLCMDLFTPSVSFRIIIF